jgi:CHAT domain-containing protein/Tfp pilus assembly protein PilF
MYFVDRDLTRWKMGKSNFWRGVVLCALLAVTAGHRAAMTLAMANGKIIYVPPGQDNKDCEISNAEGLTLYQRGRYDEALEQLQAALDCFRKASDRVGEGMALNNIGDVYKGKGMYKEALEHYFRAEIIFDGEDTKLGVVLNNIGEVYLSLGLQEKALDYFEDALFLYRGADDDAGIAGVLNNIGAALRKEGRYDEALDYFEDALAICIKLKDLSGEAIVRGNMGQTYSALGLYPKALGMYEQASIIFRELRYRTEEATALGSIGDVYLDLRRYTEAMERYQEARIIYHEVGNQFEEVVTLSDIGLVYQRKEAYTDALESYRQAMDILEIMRPAASGSEEGKVAFNARFAGLYARAIDLFHQRGRDEEAFVASERSRARAFLDSLATDHVELTDGEVIAMLVQEQKACTHHQKIQETLDRDRSLDPSNPELADVEEQLAEAEKECNAARAAAEAQSVQLGVKALKLPDVQDLLDERTILVSYYVLDHETLAFIITHDSFHTVDLYKDKDELREQIVGFRNFSDFNLEVAHPGNAVMLYKWLIEPLKDYLPLTNSGQGTAPHLIIVPHNVLHYLPFAALTDGQRYLVDDYIITYLPSASVLPFIQGNISGSGGTPLVLGGPWGYAEQEAKDIANLYGTRPLLGEAATESALRERVSQASILHLSAHSSYSKTNPLASAIYLEQDADAGDDGRLEVREVYGLDLTNVNLVVLSACETQLGVQSAGDEVVGLTRAFFFAGTPSVVATLWPVDAQSTKELMKHFYTYLQSGMSKAGALRQAQLDTRANFPSPYDWSAFVLSGDGGRVGELAKRSRGMPLVWLIAGGGVLIVVVAGVLIVVVAGVLWRRRGRRSIC